MFSSLFFMKKAVYIKRFLLSIAIEYVLKRELN